jgi:hypothetical protein
MSEPSEAAEHLEQIAPGVWHWSVHNANIAGNISASHALGDEDGSVWIDPARVNDPESLPRPTGYRAHQPRPSARRLGLPARGVPFTPARGGATTRSPTCSTAKATLCCKGWWRSRRPASATPSSRCTAPPRARRRHSDWNCSGIVPSEPSSWRMTRSPTNIGRTGGWSTFDLLLIGHSQPVSSDPQGQLQSLLADN